MATEKQAAISATPSDADASPIFDKIINKEIPSTVVYEDHKWLASFFRPAIQMRLSNEEIAVATFIFGRSEGDKLDPSEILVRTNDGFESATRKTIKGLLPAQMIDQEVLNIVACMLTEQERTRTNFPAYWFLPTMFAQYIDAWRINPTNMVKHYGMKFMGFIDSVKKIYIPLNDDNLHWYLMVVDLCQREIILLDSFPEPSHSRSRIWKVKKVALFIDDMLQHQVFYDSHVPDLILVSDFPIVAPQRLQLQRDYSNDGGIFVAKWMINHASEDYVIDVDNGTRLRIALDLVTKTHNKICEEVKSKAIEQIK